MIIPIDPTTGRMMEPECPIADIIVWLDDARDEIRAAQEAMTRTSLCPTASSRRDHHRSKPMKPQSTVPQSITPLPSLVTVRRCGWCKCDLDSPAHKAEARIRDLTARGYQTQVTDGICPACVEQMIAGTWTPDPEAA